MESIDNADEKLLALKATVHADKKVIAVLEGPSRTMPQLDRLLECRDGNRQVIVLHKEGEPMVPEVKKPGHFYLGTTPRIMEALNTIRPDVVVVEKFFTAPSMEKLLIEGIKRATPGSKIAIQGYLYSTENAIPHAQRVCATRDGYLMLPSDDKAAANLVLGVFGRLKSANMQVQDGMAI